MGNMKYGFMVLILLVSACSGPTPYTESIEQMRKGCEQGSNSYCDALPGLLSLDAQYRAQRDADSARTAALLLGAIAVGAAAYSATQPHYVVSPSSPVYVRQPLNCTSINLGGGMVSTNCW